MNKLFEIVFKALIVLSLCMAAMFGTIAYWSFNNFLSYQQQECGDRE